jgi:hypothetical protein
MVTRYPAPWSLEGCGYILAYRFPRAMKGNPFFTSDIRGAGEFSGFGTVMLVDYRESTAGPYRELLFSPGRFRHNGKTLPFHHEDLCFNDGKRRERQGELGHPQGAGRLLVP